MSVDKITVSTYADALLASVHYYAHNSSYIHEIFFNDAAYLAFSMYSNFILNLRLDLSITDPVGRLALTDLAYNNLDSYKKVTDLVADIKVIIQSMGLPTASLRKRGATSTSFTAEEIKSYLAYCVLNSTDVTSSGNILVGCIAGVQAYCQQSSSSVSQCRSYWDATFYYSIYAPLRSCFGWNLNADNCKLAYSRVQGTSMQIVGDFLNYYAFPLTVADRKSGWWI
jgi:hypothetical protein